MSKSRRTNLLHFGGGRSEEFDIPRADRLFVSLQRRFCFGVILEHDEGVAGGAAVAQPNEQNAIFPVQNLRLRMILARSEELGLNDGFSRMPRGRENGKGWERSKRGRKRRE